MKPKIIHQQAMDFSFQAKQALDQGNYSGAFELYIRAAELESQVAEFYFDQPDLEPTRSVIIRSAAYMNIKAGQIEQAKKFIFFGLLNTKDVLIKEQLNNALELAVSLSNMTAEAASQENYYLNRLRQRSVHYVIEPANIAFGHSVNLEMIKDFLEDYLKSLKAYAVSKLKKLVAVENEIEGVFAKEIQKLIQPLLTGSAYGSFKFSIANDFLLREGEKEEVTELKANVVTQYHNEIFINPLADNDIELIKTSFSEEEVNEIFRPLAKIKANNSSYKVGYYDSEDYNKKFVPRIINKQKQKLLTVKPINQVDIGELENSIIHKISSQSGKTTKTTIYREQLKSAEWNVKTNQIESTNNPSLILSEDIVLDINFNSSIGFTCSYSDFGVENTDIKYDKSLKGFYNAFYSKMKELANKESRNENEQRDWEVVKKLIGNPDALKK